MSIFFKAKRCTWLNEEISLLLYIYGEHQSLFSINRNTFWKTIKEELNKKGYEKTLPQIKDKIDKLKSEYKKVNDHNKRTGVDPKTCNFYDVSKTFVN